MVCDLCRRDSQEIIRVDSWQVCQWCISNKVLDHALEVRANIKILQEAVANASVEHRDDEKRKEIAEFRLVAAYSELEAAMKELAGISAASHESMEKSLAGVKALQEYVSVEDTATKKARDEPIAI